MSDHEELESSVGPWVLGALDPDEAEAVRVHVEGCASCREVATRLQRVVGALPLAVEEVTLPPRLRERVLAAAVAPPAQPARAALPVRRQAARPRPVSRSRIPTYALAAVAVVALLIGVVAGQVAFRTPQQSQVLRFALTGHGGMSGVQATVVDLRADGVALVDFRGLPPLAADRVYEVWLIPAKGDPVPAAVFVPDSNGAKVVLVNRSLAGYSVMAVTSESGPNGSQTPTEQPQLSGSVA